MRNIAQQILGNVSTIIVVVSLGACVQTKDHRLDLMPTPLIYSNAVTQNLIVPEQANGSPYEGVLYVTDRAPSDLEKRTDKLKEYSKNRSAFLSAGLNTVVLNQFGKNQLSISKVETYGILKAVKPYGPLTDLETMRNQTAADNKFIGLINKKLHLSKQQDIFIYVHGAHNTFESPPLIAGELWHYLGYEGVMINFLWPATPARFGYFKDIENAQISGHNLELLIRYLAKVSHAKRIHLVSHSAGGRVVLTALRKLAIAGQDLDGRIGNALLIASDLNPSLLGIALADGVAEVPHRMTIYVSAQDTALRVSEFLFKGFRLGQLNKKDVIAKHIIDYFDNNNVDVVDVSSAPEIHQSHGHSYFRSSPWVSSDIISSLRFDLRPIDRSLNRIDGQVAWQFPETYDKDIESVPININETYKIEN